MRWLGGWEKDHTRAVPSYLATLPPSYLCYNIFPMSDQPLPPLLIHLPILLLVIGGLLDLYGFARRRPAYQHAAVLLLVVGLLGGVLSAVIGFGVVGSPGRSAPAGLSPSASLHAVWAIATLVVFGGLLALRLAARRGWSPQLKGMYIVLAIVGIIGLAITGFYGAELISSFGN